jgi:hypothetical protein
VKAVSEEEDQYPSTFKKDKWYSVPYLRGSDSTHQIYICRKILQAPCVCCGQDHPEAEIMKDDMTGEEYGKYTCEVSRVNGKSFAEAVMEKGKYRHIPCPQLFALRNGFQTSDVTLAWDIFMEKGYGNCIPYRKLRTLWEEIMEICRSEKESWTFKRDITWIPNTAVNSAGGDGSSEMEDTMSEEDSRNDPTEQMNSTKCISPKSNF